MIISLVKLCIANICHFDNNNWLRTIIIDVFRLSLQSIICSMINSDLNWNFYFYLFFPFILSLIIQDLGFVDLLWMAPAAKRRLNLKHWGFLIKVLILAYFFFLWEEHTHEQETKPLLLPKCIQHFDRVLVLFIEFKFSLILIGLDVKK